MSHLFLTEKDHVLIRDEGVEILLVSLEPVHHLVPLCGCHCFNNKSEKFALFDSGDRRLAGPGNYDKFYYEQ